MADEIPEDTGDQGAEGPAWRRHRDARCMMACVLTRKDLILLDATQGAALSEAHDSVREPPLCATGLSSVETLGNLPPKEAVRVLLEAQPREGP